MSEPSVKSCPFRNGAVCHEVCALYWKEGSMCALMLIALSLNEGMTAIESLNRTFK